MKRVKQNIYLPVTITRDCIALLRPDDAELPMKAGEQYGYAGHEVGGNVVLDLPDGRKAVVHPAATDIK